nr:hypothetical protein [Nocardioides ungokensis]
MGGPASGRGRGLRLGLGRAAAFRDVLGLVGRRGQQVADEVQAVPVGQPGRGEQGADVGRSHDLAALPGAPGREDLAGAGVQRHQGGELVERLADGADQQEADHPQDGAEPEPHELERQRAGAGVGQQRVEGGAALLVVRVPPGQRGAPYPSVRRLRVEDHGLRDDEGPVAGGRGAPAEVDVVAEDGQLLVETAELLQHPTADQHPGGVDRQHGADLVVLPLVVLTTLESGLAPAGAGDGDAQLEQPLQRGPLAQLGAEHVGLGVRLGRCQQRGQGVGLGVGVVVEDPHPLAVGAGRGQPIEPQRHRGGEGGGPGRAEHLVERLFEQGGAAVLAAGVDRDHAIDGRDLTLESGDHRREPALSIVADQQRGDRRMHDQEP